MRSFSAFHQKKCQLVGNHEIFDNLIKTCYARLGKSRSSRMVSGVWPIWLLAKRLNYFGAIIYYFEVEQKALKLLSSMVFSRNFLSNLFLIFLVNLQELLSFIITF